MEKFYSRIIFKIDYGPSSQIRFLRILYNRIEQNLTYDCIDEPRTNITIVSLDDIQYNINQLSGVILHDECQVNLLFFFLIKFYPRLYLLQNQQQGSIKYIINTSDHHLLPIISVIPLIKNIHVSQVCFF